MDIIVPRAEDKALMPVESFSIEYNNREVTVTWITTNNVIRLEAIPAEDKAGFVIEIRDGVVDVTAFSLKDSDTGLSDRIYADTVTLNHEKTGQLEDSKLAYLVDKGLKAVEDYKAAADNRIATTTDISTLL